ncbi:MAG: hypothetical protein ACOCUV_03980, partial [bacterium]
MMKKIIFICLSICYSIICIAQYEIPIDTVIVKTGKKEFREFASINVIDSFTIEHYLPKFQQSNDSMVIINKKFFHIPNEEIIYVFIVENWVFFRVRSEQEMEYRFIKYDVKSRNSGEMIFNTEYQDNRTFDLSRKYFFSITRRNNIRLNLINLDCSKEILFSDFSNLAKRNEYPDGRVLYDGGISDAFIIDEKSAIIKLGLVTSAELGFEDYKYFIVNNDKKQDITSRVVPDSIVNKIRLPNSTMQMVSADGKFIRESLAYYDRNTSKGINRLIDVNYKTKSELLIIGHNASHNDGIYVSSHMLINGINMQNGRIVHYFVNSYLDYEGRRRDAEVIIPYEFVPQLEIAMYNAYNNKLL